MPAFTPAHTELAVKAFYHEHGLDSAALHDESATEVLHDAIKEVAVRSEDLLEIVVRVELDGDRLAVTLDDEASVIDVTER